MRTNENLGSIRGGASRFISIVGMLGLIVGLVGTPWRQARAEIQNDLIGFSPNHVFESAEAGEHIDVMSGNMTLSVPLGPRYKLTDDFTWGLTLYYNSKVWEHVCSTTMGALCTGTLPSDLETQISTYSYGLGWTMGPGRVYQNSNDYPFVYRVALEDGSDHLFCDPNVYRDGPHPNPSDVNCPNYGDTADGSGIRMSRVTFGSVGGWKAVTSDGRTIEFAKLISGSPSLVEASRVTTTALRPDGNPRAWVDYSHSNYAAGYWVSGYVSDSQGRIVYFEHDDSFGHGTQTIRFPGYLDPETNARVDPVYEIKRIGLGFTDPVDPGSITCDVLPNPLKHFAYAIESIRFPGLDSDSQWYKFKYHVLDSGGNPVVDECNEPVSYGWMTQRTLPTGAVINYHYDTYRTSAKRPYHVELIAKELSLPHGNPPVTYHWNWNRFSIVPQAQVPSFDPLNPLEGATHDLGTNPYSVAARDPFNNLTLYRFNATTNDLTHVGPTYGYACNTQGECENNWSDGTLMSVETFAGPNPDSEHLVRRVDYEWDSALGSDPANPAEHAMFQYRRPTGVVYPYGPRYINTTPVNVHQVNAKTFVPRSLGSGGHTVAVQSSEWNTACPEARRKNEYVDGVLYRSTYTDTFLDSAHNCATHRYVQVTDAAGSVVSHVDRLFTDGQMECEVRRKGSGPFVNIADCSGAGLSLQPGDVATVNTFDATATREVIQTTVSGGDTADSRSIALGYLQYTVPIPNVPGQWETGNTPYLATKTFPGSGFTWNAVNRTVDLATGWTQQTHDPAGNSTSYQWDTLGRLKAIIPGCGVPLARHLSNCPEKPTFITYPNVKETHVTQALSPTNFVETVYSYDDLGRLITTQRRNSTGGYDIQNTEYDIAGRVTRKSEWASPGTDPANLKWTTYDYTIYVGPSGLDGMAVKYPDPLGRIHGITTPDDPSPETPTTETSYDGDVTTVTVRDIRGVAGGADNSVTSTTSYAKDPLGRLISVSSAANGAKAAYTYDTSDNLTDVTLTDPADSTKIQRRRFDYDRLGRLRGAINPENGTVAYNQYDSRGNLLNYVDALQSTFTMTYDNADRLLTQMQGTVPLTENTYDGTTSRLSHQISSQIDSSVNPTAIRTVSHVEFGYGDADSSALCGPAPGWGFQGLNGRLKWQKSTLSSPRGDWTQTVETDYCQDGLGMPSVINYPDVANSGRTRSTVASTYKNGYLSTLVDDARGPRYVTNVTYAAGGVPTEIDRQYGKELISLDGRNRPSRIESVGYRQLAGAGGSGDTNVTCAEAAAHPGLYPVDMSANCVDAGGGGSTGWVTSTIWDSGQYAYDMAGNVKTIGLEQYYYDSLSRLVNGSIPGVGLTYWLGYTYDAFGNMTQQSRTLSTSPSSPLTRNYFVDWQTNRLTQQTLIGSPTATYIFDENGNMVSKGSLGAARSLVYDGQNRLREVMDPTGGRIGSYGYDASGYRVRAESDGKETFYIRDASGQVLSEFQRPLGASTAPAWNKDYIYALGKSFALVQNDIPAAPNRPWVSGTVQPAGSNPGSLTLQWDAVNEPDILYYVVTMRFWKTNGWIPSYTTVPASQSAQLTTVSTFTSTFAANCLKYTVAAYDTAGNQSEEGPELWVCPQQMNTAPPAPTLVTATAANRSVRITWDPPDYDPRLILGYFVERKTSPTAWTTLNAIPLTNREFVETQLLPNGGYRYQVFTRDTANHDSAHIAAIPSPAYPFDTVAPGKITNVFAEPNRDAGYVDLYWKRGDDLDVTAYKVFRVATPPSSDVLVDTVPAGTQVDYSSLHLAAVASDLFYIVAVDSRGNPSISSDRVGTRPRTTSITAPVLSGTLQFTTNDKGTTSLDGIPASVTCIACDPGCPCPDGGNVSAENDDDVMVRLTWSPSSVPAYPTGGYRIYRKASDELRFTRIAETGCSGSTCTYDDKTAMKANYTYYVTAFKPTGSVVDESAASQPSGSSNPAADHAVMAIDWPNFAVRNLKVFDGRDNFTPENNVSRLATVYWSRVAKPGVVGYNLYRSCSFWTCAELGRFPDEIEAFSCVPEWVRVNMDLLSPEQRKFSDGQIGGLQGCFSYAVRPVGPGGVEGKISKIVVANLNSLQLTSAPSPHSYAALLIADDDLQRNAACIRKVCRNQLDQECGSHTECPPGNSSQQYCTRLGFCSNPAGQRCVVASQCSPGATCNIDTYLAHCIEEDNGEFVPFEDPVDTVLNRTGTGINQQVRGGGAPNGVPPTIASAAVELKTKETWNGWILPTELVQVSWVLENPVASVAPTDLAGYYIESAGSLEGPWQRLTSHPVAWWENRYTVQGVAAPFDLPNAHTECLKYRVIAVDEQGNESLAKVAEVDPSTTITTCPKTPIPPENLHASDGTVPPSAPHLCSTKLMWNKSPDATEYYVYRMILSVYAYTPPYFDRAVVPSTATSSPTMEYIVPWTTALAPVRLSAYYVTARKATGGESPRSNITFWACGQNGGAGYSRVMPSEAATDGIAELITPATNDTLACWITDAVRAEGADSAVALRPDASRPEALTTAPLLRLGTLMDDPPWELYGLHTDHLGTVRAMTSITSSGEVTKSRHNYFPFGEAINDGTSAVSHNTHQYTGHERDKATDMDYMLARYYEAGLGRFLSADPLAASAKTARPQSWNRYTYAADNPIKNFDPDGRDAVASTDPSGITHVVIPVHFTGSGATPSNVAAIVGKDNGLKITGDSKVKVEVVATDKPIHGVLNSMDLSAGADKTFGPAGEGTNRLGGDKAHINTSNGMSNEAASHDVLHFAGIKDQYTEGPPDKNGNRTSTPTPGYTDDNVMTSRGGDELKPAQLQEAVDNPTTKKDVEKK